MLTQNTHFAIGVHVLSALAYNPDKPVPSADLARSVNTNAAFLRTVIGRLREAGLVETRLGKGGGALLGRKANTITLLDVYQAVEERSEINCHECPSDSGCPVADTIPDILNALSSRLSKVLSEELKRTSISDIAKQIPPLT